MRLYVPENLPSSTRALVLASMEIMVFTMLRWREQLFSGELKDIHAYDDSLLADFETILSLLEPTAAAADGITEAEDSDTLMFF